MKTTITLPNLPSGFECAPDERLEVELSGAALHLLKWLVAEKRTNCSSLAEAIEECVEQGFKYHKRLFDAEQERKAKRTNDANQALFERWCELNAAKAKDPLERGYQMAQYGLLDPAIAEMFKNQMAAKLKAEADAKAKADKDKKTA